MTRAWSIGASKIARDISDRRQAAARQPQVRGGDRVLRRCDHHQGSQQHHHVMESSGRADVWLHGRRSDRPVDPHARFLTSSRQKKMSCSRKSGAARTIDHYETVRQRKDGARLTISLTVSPIRDENGVIVGASKVARDITERARLLAAAREHAANNEKLAEVGSVVTSTLDRDVIVQKVTDVATALTHAQFGAFFYNVTDPALRRRVHAVHAVRRPARSLCEISAPARHGGFAPTFHGEGPVRLDDVTADPRYGKTLTVLRHAAGASARAQLPGGAGEGSERKCPRRIVLWPFRGGCLHGAARAAGAGRVVLGIGRAGERPALRGRAGRQPAEGRVPRRALARAAYPAQRDRRLCPPPSRRHPAARQGSAGDGDARTKRDVADADRRGRPRCFANRLRKDSVGRPAGGAAAHRR